MRGVVVGGKAKTAILLFVVIFALTGFSGAQAKTKEAEAHARERLIGAWRLVSLGEVGADGKMARAEDLKGTLIYTADGRMSVQIMYPPAQSSLTNDYVLNGYEASFGRYDVDEAKHTLTHHVEGSITPGLVGKDLTRAFRFSDGRLIIQSTRVDEHWQAVWERY
jgi:hypothetical protein